MRYCEKSVNKQEICNQTDCDFLVYLYLIYSRYKHIDRLYNSLINDKQALNQGRQVNSKLNFLNLNLNITFFSLQW